MCFVLMTCFSYRAAAKFDSAICKSICVVFILGTQLTTSLTSSWPELACSLSAQPWLVSCSVSVPWSGPPRTHTDITLHCLLLDSDLASAGTEPLYRKGKKKMRKKKKASCGCRCRLSSTELSYKEECRGRCTAEYPHTYLHPPQERFSVSAGATKSGRDSKYSTILCRMLSPVV